MPVKKSGKKVKGKADKIVEVCPNCGSSNIEYATTMRESTISIAGFGLPEKYYCKNCGYEGSVILEMPQSKVGRAPFPRKHVKIEMPDRGSVEVLRPVFATSVLVFFVVCALFFFTAAYFVGPEEEPEYFTIMGEKVSPVEIEQPLQEIGSVTIPGISQEIVFKETPSGQMLVAVVNVSMFSLGTATGIQGVTGFTFSLFIMVFFAAFVVLMVLHHWKRKLHFI